MSSFLSVTLAFWAAGSMNLAAVVCNVIPPASVTNAVALGAVPVTVTLTGTNNPDSANIVACTWDFGDGATMVTGHPVATHTYCSTGQVAVTLTATTRLGFVSVYSNAFTLAAQTNLSFHIWHVASNGSDTNGDGTQANPYLTIQKAGGLVQGGDYVAVHRGTYNENVDLKQNTGAIDKRITFIGYGAQTYRFNIRYPYYTVDGFTIGGQSYMYSGLIYVYPPASYTWVANCTIGPAPSNTFGIYMPNAGSTNIDSSASYCAVSNCVLTGINYIQITAYGRSNRFVGNISMNGIGQDDFFRIWGQGHYIGYNQMTNQTENTTYIGHTDFYQIWGMGVLGGGTNPAVDVLYAQDILLENNIVWNSDSQSVTIENYINPPGCISNIVFRNNIFANLNGAGSINADGSKWYNNLWYRVSTAEGGHVLAFGGPRGEAYGTEMMNNVFAVNGYKQGVTTNIYGWYPIVGAAGVSNWAMHADYNFVCMTNWLPELVAPPDYDGRFQSQGQDPHGVNGGDPHWVSIANLNFTPTNGSVLIGAGTNLSWLFTTDMNGAPRPATGAWDIGPIQHSGSGYEPPPSLTNFRIKQP